MMYTGVYDVYVYDVLGVYDVYLVYMMLHDVYLCI